MIDREIYDCGDRVLHRLSAHQLRRRGADRRLADTANCFFGGFIPSSPRKNQSESVKMVSNQKNNKRKKAK